MRMQWTIAIVFVFSFSPIKAQTHSYAPHVKLVPAGNKSPLNKRLPMSMTAPLFLESETYTSTLYLVNQLNFGVQADVSVYDMSGALLTTGHRYLEANSDQTISVLKLLEDAGMFAQAGIVEVLSPPDNTDALLGQLSITRTGEHTAYLDEELFMPAVAGSNTLRAVIDSPQNSPIVSIANVSPVVTQTIHLNCILSTGNSVLKVINLQPKETKLVRACSALGDEAPSPDAIDSQFILEQDSPLGMSGQQVAGISISADGPPGEIAAFGFVEHADMYGRYFSAMNFADPGSLKSSSTVFVGVPVGRSAVSGADYTPQVALTNFSQSPQNASIYFATSASGLSDLTKVAEIEMPANSSKFVDLPGITGSPRWENSFVVRSSGQPGDVLSKMMFKTTGTLPNVELIGKDEQDAHNGGDHPWSLESGMRSILYLFNHGDTTRKVSIRLGFGKEVWLKMYEIYPNETKAIIIEDLIQRETRDDKGYAFPRSVTHGEVSWWAPKAGAPEVSGRVVQTDSKGTMARNFSCGTSMGICGVNPSAYGDYFSIGIDDSDDLTAQPAYCVYPDPVEYGGCPSSGQTTNQTTSLQWEWNVQNPNIAQITAGSTTAKTTWKGMSMGSTPFSVVAMVNEENYCTAQGSGEVPPMVTFGTVATIILGGADAVVPVTFTGGATSSAVPITLTLTPSGKGGAIFTSGGTIATGGLSTVIMRPTTITIHGTSQTFSSTPDITLNATIMSSEGNGTMPDATNPQSFGVTAIPVNFVSPVPQYLSDGTLSFKYTFSSSSGNMNDLANCLAGETVFYPGSANPYVWPLPMVSQTMNPTTRYNIPSGYFMDTNSPPSGYSKPYFANSFSATQRLQWECPLYMSGSYQEFVSDITITRSVSQMPSGSWQYKIQKSGYTNTFTLP